MTTTTSRLLSLLSLLQTRRDWPGSVLAARLDISQRTVRRDVDRLRGMGYRIEASMGPEGGYRLDAGNDLPPLLFDDDQVVALAVALRAATLTGIGIEEPALRALTTVRQVMPSRLRHRMNAFEFTAIPRGLHGPTSEMVSPDLLIALSQAARAREILRFDYTSQRVDSALAGSDPAPPPPRRVEPHDLVTADGRWYLLGWDVERDGWRTFRADRITLRTPNGPHFTPRDIPGGDAAAYVSARFKGAKRADQWPCTAHVVLHRPAVDVLPFAGDGTVEDLGPDRCGLTLGSWSWIALAASLNRFDTDVEVIEPPELTEAFTQLATRNARTANRSKANHNRA